ncbi:Uncharacterised protein [Chlamydia trachomatis]|nr:Uncharacterised protein [Chlamydia trachomatis]
MKEFIARKELQLPSQLMGVVFLLKQVDIWLMADLADFTQENVQD